MNAYYEALRKHPLMKRLVTLLEKLEQRKLEQLQNQTRESRKFDAANAQRDFGGKKHERKK